MAIPNYERKTRRAVVTAAALAVSLAFQPRTCFAGGPSPEQVKYLCEDIKEPMFREKGRAGESRLMAPNRPGLKADGFLLPKPQGALRIFIVGESVAGLLADPRYPGFGSLGRTLVAGRVLEVINCGMGGYDSRRILEVFKEVSGYDPDLVIVLSGNNELGVETCPGMRADLEKAKRAIKIKFESLFSDAKEAERAARLSLHKERLLGMAALARDKKFPVMFCTLPANEKDFAPYGVPGAEPPAAGADGLQAAVRAAPRDPYAHYRLARALAKSGDLAGAKEHYDLAIEWDSLGDRCSASRNAMIREAALSGGACLADLEKDFSAAAAGRLVGGEFLADGVHWHYRLNAFVAASLWREAAACRASARRFFPSGPPSASALDDAAKKALDDVRAPAHAAESAAYALYYAAAYARQGLPDLWEREISLLDRVDRTARAALLAALRNRKTFVKGMPSNIWVSDLPGSSASWWPRLLYSAAEMWRRKGEAALADGVKVSALKAGPPAGPDDVPGPFAMEYKRKSVSYSDSGVDKFRSGDMAGARADLEAAVDLDPDNIPALLTLCTTLIRLREYSPAAASCGAAVNAAKFPSPGALMLPGMLQDALLLRAEVYEKTGESGKAAADLEAALAVQGDSWPDRHEAELKLQNLKTAGAVKQ